MKTRTQTSTFLQWDIEDLPILTTRQIYNLQSQKIFKVYHFFLDGYTCKKIDNLVGVVTAKSVNVAFSEIGFTGRLTDLKFTEPLYSFYHKKNREKIHNLHEKAIEIMCDVHWGEISKKIMSDELSYLGRGIIVTEKDIEKIIKEGLKILES
ncbi:MAG: hypothetical protein WD335_02500 [Candidatus Paceibacterota bacterium]